LISATGQSLKRVIETRWSARGDAVKVVKKHFSNILNTLEELTGEEENSLTRADAGVLLNAVQSFSFLCFFNLWESILSDINDTQIFLQKKGLNLHQCDTKLECLQTYISSNRDDFIDNSVAFSKSMCDDLGIVIEKRVRKKKKMFDEGSSDSCLTFEEQIKREMFAFLDRVIQEIKERFKQIHNLLEKYAIFRPTNSFE